MSMKHFMWSMSIIWGVVAFMVGLNLMQGDRHPLDYPIFLLSLATFLAFGMAGEKFDEQ